MACLTADANCSSVMSSTKTVLAEGSSGRASADPIISTVIPCKKKKKEKFHENSKADHVYVQGNKSDAEKHISRASVYQKRSI